MYHCWIFLNTHRHKHARAHTHTPTHARIHLHTYYSKLQVNQFYVTNSNRKWQIVNLLEIITSWELKHKTRKRSIKVNTTTSVFSYSLYKSSYRSVGEHYLCTNYFSHYCSSLTSKTLKISARLPKTYCFQLPVGINWHIIIQYILLNKYKTIKAPEYFSDLLANKRLHIAIRLNNHMLSNVSASRLNC